MSRARPARSGSAQCRNSQREPCRASMPCPDELRRGTLRPTGARHFPALFRPSRVARPAFVRLSACVPTGVGPTPSAATADHQPQPAAGVGAAFGAGFAPMDDHAPRTGQKGHARRRCRVSAWGRVLCVTSRAAVWKGGRGPHILPFAGPSGKPRPTTCKGSGVPEKKGAAFRVWYCAPA